MRRVDAFAREVEEWENIFIPLSDGARLAARVWLPKDAVAAPVPAILEYLPYRKRDGTVHRDALTHPYLAGHGYACLRVDMRGNGDSDGIMEGEYLPQEQDDALEVIAWLRRQPWCTGRVGMIGISWGGFNGLQVAWRQPEGLDAVISLCSTDDRYADDIHYKGGCLLCEQLGWSSTMLAYSSRPGDPLIVGDKWRAQWLERLEREPHLASVWMEHLTRDAFWKHGSICEDYGRIRVAVMLVGAWADSYHDPVPRMLTHLTAPRQAIIGPWVHKYPHFAVPGPRIGFLQEAVRFYDRYLKDLDNGADQAPALRAYLMDSVPPATQYEHRPGRWVAEAAWPSPGITTVPLHLGRGRLSEAPEPAEPVSICSPQTVGQAAGEYCPIWLGPELPGDQRIEDGGSLLFDGQVLQDDLTILGGPVLEITFQADRPQANLAVRLCDVAPNGASARVTYGVLNLCHHTSHEHPEKLVPGQRYRARIELDEVGYRFPAGHRLRLAVSTAYWPLIWPSPENATVTLALEECRLLLPVRPPRAHDPAPSFAEPEAAAPLEEIVHRPATNRRVTTIDAATGIQRLEIVDDFGEFEIVAHGLVTGSIGREWYEIHPDDPLSARMRTHWTETSRRGDWQVRTESFASMQADRTHFHLTARVEAYEGDLLVFTKEWATSHARGCV
ncbi:CocE/NonD family hydrolase [Geminicoccus harenae]|uniref:CocE/NonD family hydrolase n=1 Tax=Geminicoccus harenae TaxID=2498453 RepID=UPI00168BBAE8|nr:CocE/NonD family hydrolase [Geminicoccus harenae]